MLEQPILERKVFNQADFELLGWHDSCIYSVAFNETTNNLIFNIDYIIKWIYPEEHKRDNTFDFWVSPAILIFRDVFSWEINLKAENCAMQFEIIHISRSKSMTKTIKVSDLFDYSFECSPDNSEIKIYENVKFDMYILSDPIYCLGQAIEPAVRRKIMKDNIDFLFELGVV